jgi:peroxiredoxin
MAAQAPQCEIGFRAPDFELPSTHGRIVRLADVAGPNGTVIAFICNHCPYVTAVIDRMVRDAKDLAPLGVSTVAICSNDADSYPEDSFENMKVFAERHSFPFPYLHDASQEVARAYGAICTPDFFGFSSNLSLQYRGRLDASRKEAGPENLKRELFEAMRQIAETGVGPDEQFPAMGCSIKWCEAT